MVWRETSQALHKAGACGLFDGKAPFNKTGEASGRRWKLFYPLGGVVKLR